MQKITFLFFFLCCTVSLLAQHPSAIAEYESTEKGILIPRMSTANRMAINTPANSLLVYDTTSASFWHWQDTAWIEIASGDVNTDDQNLSLTGTMLNIEDGTGVDLSGIDTDNQDLSLTGTMLNIEDGTGVDISGIDTDTDDQTLTFDTTTNQLTISEGNSVNPLLSYLTCRTDRCRWRYQNTSRKKC